MRVAYLSNARPRHSTENHLTRALRSHGHAVTQVQEDDLNLWRRLTPTKFDLLLWTRTAWHWPDPEVARSVQEQTIGRFRDAGVPVVGYHLDRWWGLARETEIATEPFFRLCDLLVTADGGHDEQWQSAGIRHVWLPPAVSEGETAPGAFRPNLASDIAFVGSWQGTYHAEWPHRAEMVGWLRDTYGPRVRFWPQPGQHALRGQALRDLYASVKVLVGDSCLVGGSQRYISDRVPETLGRGGYLIHPDVDGVTDGTHYQAGHHLGTWPLGDWSAVRQRIGLALADEPGRLAVARRGRDHVLAHHTYERRVEQLMALLPVGVV